MDNSQRSNLTSKVVVTEDGTVRYYWRGWVTAISCAFMGVFIMGTGIYMFADGLDMFILLCILFPMGILPGLGLLYFATGKAFNYTEFRVEGNDLLIRHKPLPWWGNSSVPIHEVGEIDVDIFHDKEHKEDIYYQVTAFYQGDGHKTQLISNPNFEIADALARELRNTLGKSRHAGTEERIAAFRKKTEKATDEEMRRSVNSRPWTLILLFLFGIFYTLGGMYDRQEWQASQNWPSVTGKVVNNEIVSKIDKRGTYYTLVVTYQYSVNDVLYTSQRVRIEAPSDHNEPYLASKTYDGAYAINTQVNVYYDPDKPERALLDRQTFNNKNMPVGIILIAMGFIGIPVRIWLQRRYAKKAKKKNLPG